MNEFFQNLSSKVKSLFIRGTIKNIDDTKEIQLVQSTLNSGESIDGLAHPQEFGFSSFAPLGSESINSFINGNLSNGYCAVIYNRENKPVLRLGESEMYNAFGSYIKLKDNKKIEISAKQTNVKGVFEVNEGASVVCSASGVQLTFQKGILVNVS